MKCRCAKCDFRSDSHTEMVAHGRKLHGDEAYTVLNDVFLTDTLAPLSVPDLSPDVATPDPSPIDPGGGDFGGGGADGSW